MAATGTSPGRLEVSTRDRVGWIVLDNPARLNAMSLPMWRALEAAAGQFADDPVVRCVVVRGAGTAAFCAGADISEFAEAAECAEDPNLLIERVTLSALTALRRLAKPTLAMASGYCIGGGLALALACDLRIGAVGSSYGIPAARLGLGYLPDGLRRLADLVGPSRAKQLIFTAARVRAEEAYRIGLLNELVSAEDLEVKATEMADMIAANAPLTIAAAKLGIDLGLSPTDAERTLAEEQARACYASDDFQEGRRAFAERRPPAFNGR